MKRLFLITILIMFFAGTAFAGSGLSVWEKLSGDVADGDYIASTDVSDTTQSAEGSSKAITAAQLKTYMAIPVAGTDFNAYDANLPTWPAAVSAAEIAFVDGVTSSIQDQLDGKPDSVGGSLAGNFDDFAIYQITGVLATAIASGDDCVIASVGTTDFTAIGASANTVGIRFTATGAGTGDGTVDIVLPINEVLAEQIAAGTAALGTSAISDGACATAVTVSASGVLTTDMIDVGFQATPVGVTGYDPTAGDMLFIISYPTSDNVNFLVCNRTGSSVTPGAMTLNWRVDR